MVTLRVEGSIVSTVSNIIDKIIKKVRNRKVPGANSSRFMAGLWDPTSYETLGDLWVEISIINSVINIGLVRLSP